MLSWRLSLFRAGGLHFFVIHFLTKQKISGNSYAFVTFNAVKDSVSVLLT
jgi:hypothetical protein